MWVGPSHIDEERSRKKALSGIECFTWRSCLTVFHERIVLFYMTSFAQNSFQQSSAQACCFVKLRGGFIKQFPVASNKLKLFTLRSVTAVVMSGSACKKWWHWMQVSSIIRGQAWLQNSIRVGWSNFNLENDTQHDGKMGQRKLETWRSDIQQAFWETFGSVDADVGITLWSRRRDASISMRTRRRRGVGSSCWMQWLSDTSTWLWGYLSQQMKAV